MYIHRQIENITKNSLNTAKIIVLYGARQTGKTTMLKNLFPESSPNTVYLTCDQSRIQNQLKPDSLVLKQLLGEKATVIFDEMQTLDNPGLILKIIYDHLPGIRAIATGSSSFDLANKVTEPLTGRHEQFQLYPFSFAEIAGAVPPTDLRSAIAEGLIFGSYPKIFNAVKIDDKIKHLNLLCDDYLYKDMLTFDLIKNSHKIRELLISLALQIGQEVSYNELGSKLGLNYKTIERYLDLLEKSFVLFRLYGFSRNLRSEITRKVKIYFYDNGVRNALMNNFNPLEIRDDSGALFENYIISELLKKNSLHPRRANFYFWRTHAQQEIDLIAEKDGQLNAMEFKLSKQGPKSPPESFIKAYPNSHYQLISWENFDSVRQILS